MMEYVYRIQIRWFNGLDRYDEAVEPVRVNERARTLSFIKSDGITISFPLEKLMFWQVAKVSCGNSKDKRLLPPPPPPEPEPRPESLDWPVDTSY
jgi:hypothetical protein